ncbi:UNVERIFIED_CONTAM: protein VASCULAR ASSOCIATED DEATH 1, chloroplastic [Sesamum radiatum]|uniref:Protein VASCULAR ASSOCIATED DEATH 1, chloroplastic n=1 Tax=Sesamum radiatum TaxID=300843 RepID=A0AAW2VMX7_SESRA
MAAAVSEQVVDPAPTSAPPIAQSMDNHNSSRRVSGDSREALDPSFASPAPSPSTQLDSQTQSPSRVEEYRQLFRLPPDEVLIQDFNCALQENFLLQGHMYVFVHYICFYSNLFGFETKKIIPFHEITSVRRAKAVAVFPTAIEIMAGSKKYFFTSFLFRDEAFKLISEGWLQHDNGSKEITEQQERKSDASSQESGSSIVEESGSSKQYVDDTDVIKSDKNGPLLEESKHVGEGEPEIISTSSVMEVQEQGNAEVPPIVECSSSEKSSVWKPEDNDAPGG